MELKEILNQFKETVEVVRCPRCGHREPEFQLYRYLNPVHCPNCGFIYRDVYTKEELIKKLEVFNSKEGGHKLSLKTYCKRYNLYDIDKIKANQKG